MTAAYVGIALIALSVGIIIWSLNKMKRGLHPLEREKKENGNASRGTPKG